MNLSQVRGFAYLIIFMNLNFRKISIFIEPVITSDSQYKQSSYSLVIAMS